MIGLCWLCNRHSHAAECGSYLLLLTEWGNSHTITNCYMCLRPGLSCRMLTLPAFGCLQDIRTADWSDEVAPFWGQVIKSAVSTQGLAGLFKAGWTTIKVRANAYHAVCLADKYQWHCYQQLCTRSGQQSLWQQ